MNKEEKRISLGDKLRGMFNSIVETPVVAESTPEVKTVEVEHAEEAVLPVTEEVSPAEFEDVTTEDGVKLSISPAVEVGASVAIVQDEEGEAIELATSYKLADGSTISIAEGVITEVVAGEEAPESAVEVEEEMSTEEVSPAPVVEEKAPKTIIERTETEVKFSALEASNEELTAKYTDLEAKFASLVEVIAEYSSEPTAEPVVKQKFNGLKKPNHGMKAKIANFYKSK